MRRAERSCGPSFSPQKRWANVPAAEVQRALRAAFGRWGCPEALRVDNGYPWGAIGGLPTGLCLWACGLGVPLLYNPPRRPWRNGVVESTQGTTQRWAEPSTCADFAELARRVAQEDVNQRERYPAIDGKSRMEAYPWLIRSGRGYCRGWERVVWDRKEALLCLAGRVVMRKVSGQGKVSLYDRMVSVGREHAGQRLEVRFDAAAEQWVFRGAGGQEVRRREAVGLSEEALVGLTATGRGGAGPRRGGPEA
jgi:hypothetical protein